MIDEATVYLNLEKIYKATTWLLRANQYTHWYWSSEEDSFKILASLGGQAKRDTYKPLIDFVTDRVKSRKYPSRRNAALSLAPEVLQLSKQLNISLSEQQAHLTIASWLKRAGLPANV